MYQWNMIALCSLESLDSSRLRTLIVFTFNARNVKLPVILNFKYLRVLKLVGSDIKLVGSIEKLKHLRHLECDGLKIHLKSIGSLVCLQTIKLLLKENIGLSTKIISKLINLRHLKIRFLTFIDETPSGFRKLSIQ